MSSYIDPASSAKVIEIIPMLNMPAGTLSPSYSAPDFTYAVDVRLFTRALIVFVINGLGTGATLDLTLKQAAGDAFSAWSTSTQTDGSAAVVPQFTPSNDNAIYTVSVDCSKTQNALGVEAVVTSTGATRARFGAYAILFPYDTTNATSPDMEI